MAQAIESIIAVAAGSDGIRTIGRLSTATMLSVSLRATAVSQGEALLTTYVEQSKTGEAWNVVTQSTDVIQPGALVFLTVPVVGPEHTQIRLALGQGTATVVAAIHTTPLDIRESVFRLASSNILKPAQQ